MTQGAESPPPLDHVVIAVADLEQAIADYRTAGFTVAPGGRHPGRPTRNALVVFADSSYLELIAYEAPCEERWYQVLARAGEGLVDFALRPHDIDRRVQAARARGLHGLTGPLDGGRTLPDGRRVVWQSARQAIADLPFYCHDVTPQALRIPEGEVRQHANGATGIAAVRVAVDDIAATLERYRAFLGPEAVRDGMVHLAGACITLEAAPGRARGPGPCAITLRGAAGQRLAPVDPALTHGAPLNG